MARLSHVTQIPKDRATQAPYNFVRLPERVFTPGGEKAPDALTLATTVGNDTALMSGWINYTIHTLAPVYTRAAVAPDANRSDNTWRDHYHLGDPSKPAIPGSTLRGLTRALVNLITESRFPRSKKRQLFYRSFGRDKLARLYGEALVEKVPGAMGSQGALQGFRTRTEPGFLTWENEQWFFQPAWALAVKHGKLPGDIHVAITGDMKVANPERQWTPVWFKAPSLKPHWRFHGARTSSGGMYTWRRDVETISDKPQQGDEWQQGWLVITGPMARKANEYVFASTPRTEPWSDARWLNGTGGRVQVPRDVMESANDLEDQITQYQERAFPANRSGRWQDGQFDTGPLDRRRPAPLGIPCWALRDARDPQRIIGVGRTANFRLRYSNNTEQSVPRDVRAPDDRPLSYAELDLTDRIFGFVRNLDGKQKADENAQRRGRVRFGDAECVDAKPFLPPLPNQRGPDRVPFILGSPKCTAFQNYLKQAESAELRLTTFEDDKTEVRGVKLYWHRNQPDGQGGRKALGDNAMFQSARVDPRGTQETAMRPVRPGVRFAGRIHFDNLTPLELGALLAAVDLPAECAHKVGMGKPLGMGSVRFAVQDVVQVDRAKRYTSWANLAEISHPVADEWTTAVRQAFVDAMVKHAAEDYGKARAAQWTDLWDLPRMRELRVMLGWTNAPAAARTEYVPLTDERWRYRWVLPHPHEVAGAPDPFSGLKVSAAAPQGGGAGAGLAGAGARHAPPPAAAPEPADTFHNTVLGPIGPKGSLVDIPGIGRVTVSPLPKGAKRGDTVRVRVSTQGGRLSVTVAEDGR